MPRLPQEGGDAGRWGGILNDYLLQEHYYDGTHDVASMLDTPSISGRVLLSDPTAQKAVQWQVPTKQMVGLANVDNTADADKPISTAMQSAFDTFSTLKADNNSVVHITGNENIAGNKTFTNRITMSLLDSTPGIPVTDSDGAWHIVGEDGTNHLAFFKDMDGDGDYDADIYFKNNAYLVATSSFHFRPGYDDGGIEQGRIVLRSILNEVSGIATNYIQSGRNFSGTTQNDLAITRYNSDFRWLLFDESRNGYAGFGLAGGDTAEEALARIHAKDGAATIALFEGTDPAGTARIALKDITTSSTTAVTIGAFGDYMILRAGATNNARLSSVGLYVGGNVVPTARVDVAAGTTTAASMRIRSGSAPSSPNDGDLWYDGTSLTLRASGSNQALASKTYVDTGGWASVPATATSTGTAGQKAFDSSNLYVCVATNTWRRVALSAW